MSKEILRNRPPIPILGNGAGSRYRLRRKIQFFVLLVKKLHRLNRLTHDANNSEWSTDGIDYHTRKWRAFGQSCNMDLFIYNLHSCSLEGLEQNYSRAEDHYSAEHSDRWLLYFAFSGKVYLISCSGISTHMMAIQVFAVAESVAISQQVPAGIGQTASTRTASQIRSYEKVIDYYIKILFKRLTL